METKLQSWSKPCFFPNKSLVAYVGRPAMKTQALNETTLMLPGVTSLRDSSPLCLQLLRQANMYKTSLSLRGNTTDVNPLTRCHKDNVQTELQKTTVTK